ncbi:MAG: hypothetical protein J6R29_07335 [Clostridia bacterium]|nr:hypothetical protein [Clostridia bacterium]
MENDVLRVENYNEADASINSSHFKNSTEINSANKNKPFTPLPTKPKKNKAYKMTGNETFVPRPKVLSSLFLGLTLVFLDVLLIYICHTTKEISYAVVCAALSSLTVPFTLTYFFCRLDTRGCYSLATIFKMFACGALAYCALEAFYANYLNSTNNSKSLILLLQSIIEIVLMLVLTVLFYSQSKKTGALTLMLIACTVTSGFSTLKSFLTTFDALFIKVQIFDGQNLSVGAIINTGDWANRSILSMFENFFYQCYYKPLIFTLLSVIIGYSLNYHFNKIARIKQNLTSNLLIIFACVFIYALMSVDTSIAFFEIIYNACAVLFPVCMLYDVLSFLMKNEKYKED